MAAASHTHIHTVSRMITRKTNTEETSENQTLTIIYAQVHTSTHTYYVICSLAAF